MSSFFLTLVALLAVAFAQNNPPAPRITDNVSINGYTVALNSGPGSITASFSFIASIGGYSTGVQVAGSLNGLNLTDDTTYTYHIHEKPVPADGNCNGTGEHLDPYHAGSSYKCDPNNQSLCQVGDLSGKHGAIHIDGVDTGAYSFTYFDDYLSTTPGNASFFGNLSVVIHRKRDGFRLNCGNFTRMASTPAASGSPSSAAGNNASTTYMSPSVSALTSVVATATVHPFRSTSSYAATVTTVQIVSGTVTAAVPPSDAASPSVFTGSSVLMSGSTTGTVMFGLIVAVAGMLI